MEEGLTTQSHTPQDLAVACFARLALSSWPSAWRSSWLPARLLLLSGAVGVAALLSGPPLALAPSSTRPSEQQLQHMREQNSPKAPFPS